MRKEYGSENYLVDWVIRVQLEGVQRRKASEGTGCKLSGVAGGVGGHHPSLVGSLGVKLSWSCLKNMQNRKASRLMESGAQGRAQGKQGPGTHQHSQRTECHGHTQ